MLEAYEISIAALIWKPNSRERKWLDLESRGTFAESVWEIN